MTLGVPKKRFCVTVFLPMMYILSCQLINRFEEMKSVVTTYHVLKPSFLSNASHLEIEVEANLLITSILIHDVSGSTCYNHYGREIFSKRN